MRKITLLLAVVVMSSVCAWAAGADGQPVRCKQSVAAENLWQGRVWAPLTRLFADRTASWVSLTPPASVRGAAACEALPEGARQVISIAFNNPAPGYFALQALGNDRLVVRVRDMFDFPLFEITAEPGDFTGTMVTQTIRLSDGDYKLELESGPQVGAVSGVVASITSADGVVLTNTSTDNACGRIIK